MKSRLHLIAALAAFGLCLGTAACGGGDEGTESPIDATLRVSAVDELTGRPVLGATVKASAAGQSADLTLAQKSDGRYAVELERAVDSMTVSVFHADYHYVSVLGVGSNDVVVPMRRLPAAKRGGITGTLTNWPTDTSASIPAGVAGLSLQGNLLDFEPALYLGDPKPTEFSLPSMIAAAALDLELPFPATFDAPGSAMIGDKTTFSVLGLPSACGDEAKEAAGTCGKQAAFSALADVTLMDAMGLLAAANLDIEGIMSMAKSEEGVDVGALIPQLLPALPEVLKLLKVGYAKDVSLAFGGEDQALLSKDLTPDKAFDVVSKVTVPALPQLMEGAPADLVGAVALVDLGEQGVLPLGLGVSQDSTAIDLMLANPGSAFNTAKRKLVVVALDTDITAAMSDPETEKVFSMLIGSFDSLPEEGVSMASQAFLAAPKGSAFDGASRTFGALPAVDGAGVHRAVIKGDNRKWIVWYGGAAQGVALPPVPAGFEDVVSADSDGHTIQALRLSSGISFDALFTDNATNADRVNALMEAFSLSVR